MRRLDIKRFKIGALAILSILISAGICFFYTQNETDMYERYGINEGRFDCVDSPAINMMLLSKIMNTENKDDLWKKEVAEYEKLLDLQIQNNKNHKDEWVREFLGYQEQLLYALEPLKNYPNITDEQIDSMKKSYHDYRSFYCAKEGCQLEEKNETLY